MVAFIVLLLAALTRLLPHALHGVGLNFTAVGGGLLFFGSRRPRWQTAIAVAIMALSDVYLTTVAYGMHFKASSYIITWVWYAAVCLLGSALLRKVTFLRVTAGVLASATGFFLISNFAVWAGSQVSYAHTLAGLRVCYVSALPFYMNDLVSTTLTAGALFGLPVLAAKLVESLRSSQSHSQPLV
jgi:hypothetical protein